MSSGASHAKNVAPGETPDETYLIEEGCAEVSPLELLEAWTRHTLAWINRLEREGTRSLLSDWRGLAKNIGGDIDFTLNGERYAGTFVGVDEDFSMLLRDGETTRTLPLSLCLETDRTS